MTSAFVMTYWLKAERWVLALSREGYWLKAERWVLALSREGYWLKAGSGTGVKPRLVLDLVFEGGPGT